MCRHLLCLLLAFVVLGCGERDSPPVVHLYAAASLVDVVEPLAQDFERASGRRVRVSLAASGTLAQQIRLGAPPGVFVSANPKWADRLEAWRLVEPGSRTVFARNSLVVAVPADATEVPRSLDDLREPRFRRVALADPEAAPAGAYAREALTRAGVWDEIHDRVVAARDVRTALAYVARGDAPVGLVYATDARGSDAVRVAFAVPPGLHAPVEYSLVVVRGAGDGATELRTHLTSTHATEHLRAAGFRTGR